MATSMHYGAKKATFQFAYLLRKNLTPAEKYLWEYLRKNSLGVRFKCQHPTWIYVVDFYCHPIKLVIEVDGSIHLLEEIHQNDLDREANLKSFELTIIRFTNDEVINDIENVIKCIENKIREISGSPL
ncbi:MAG: endonuclease domain-containing protein [Saprospiraceae bacterium]